MDTRDLYTLFSILIALMYFGIWARCVRALWRNHLEKATRYLNWGAAIFTFTQGWNHATIAVDRVMQHVGGTLTFKTNPPASLFALIMANIGVIVLIIVLEHLTKTGHKERGGSCER